MAFSVDAFTDAYNEHILLLTGIKNKNVHGYHAMMYRLYREATYVLFEPFSFLCWTLLAHILQWHHPSHCCRSSSQWVGTGPGRLCEHGHGLVKFDLSPAWWLDPLALSCLCHHIYCDHIISPLLLFHFVFVMLRSCSRLLMLHMQYKLLKYIAHPAPCDQSYIDVISSP